jgi:hypothetical protein
MPHAPVMNRPKHVRACALALLALALGGCGGCDEHEPAAPAEKPAALSQRAAAPAPAPAAPEAPAPATATKKAWPPVGFDRIEVNDQGPLCVFEDYIKQNPVPSAAEAQRQKLRANKSVVFGAWGPWCMHEDCDQGPSLECSVVRDGNTLTVHTHYWGYHKDGSTCTKDCRKVAAACESPVLEAGTYTVKRGLKSYPLKIPSVLSSPCFERE